LANLKDVIDRGGGEFGSNTFIPITSFLERNIGCGRDYVRPSCNLRVRPDSMKDGRH